MSRLGYLALSGFLFTLNAGNSRWVTAMEWSGQMEYVKANWKEFEVDGVEAGLTTGYGPLQFLKVFLFSDLLLLCTSTFTLHGDLIKWNSRYFVS